MNRVISLVNILLVGLAFVATGSLVALYPQKNPVSPKYDWSATLSAPEKYPAQVYRGSVIAKGYQQSLEGFGELADGWGIGSGSVVMGPDVKNLPERIEVAWHSFVDQSNYEGEWDLPKEKIAKLFDEGFIAKTTKKKSTYDTFTIGLAPNGLVVVWLSGAGSQVELAHFRTQKILINAEDVTENSRPIFSKKYNDVVLSELNEKYNTFENIQHNKYPPIDLYEDYRKRYLWKPLVEFSEEYRLDDYVLHTQNGEIEINSSHVNENARDAYKERGILKYLAFSWVDREYKKIATCWLENFDEAELINAFGVFDEFEKIDLIIKNIASKNSAIVLKSETKEVEIKKFKKTIE